MKKMIKKAESLGAVYTQVIFKGKKITQIFCVQNVGEMSGRCNIGGIIGFGVQVDVRYCYNRGTVQGSLNDVGGVAGALRDFELKSYANNYLYHCYNFGKVAGLNSSTVYIGTICGFLVYYDVDFCHSLGNASTIQWGHTANNHSATDIAVYTDKNKMISAILSQFGSKFKINESVEKEGYPVLAWQ